MAERGTHLVPTSEMTLAARLNMYQARAGIIVSPYPYGQEPYGAAGGGYLGTGPMESVNSFVAPSYEQDVSPPPFMTMSGKPPAYEEAVSAPACAHPPRPIPNRAPATSSAAALTDRSSSPAPFTMIPQEP
ncbi:hypothetical protein EDD11_010405 [Mortierella claussenii]|nr:hypothetical protein EDD11_010405 [Mortierella claussenii]